MDRHRGVELIFPLHVRYRGDFGSASSPIAALSPPARRRRPAAELAAVHEVGQDLELADRRRAVAAGPRPSDATTAPESPVARSELRRSARMGARSHRERGPHSSGVERAHRYTTRLSPSSADVQPPYRKLPRRCLGPWFVRAGVSPQPTPAEFRYTMRSMTRGSSVKCSFTYGAIDRSWRFRARASRQ